MLSSRDRKPFIKVAGYLEKKSKMRVVCRWKKLWFVLEGRLLLYYKSQLEYLSLSPCRGTVNLGLASAVSSPKTHEIHIATRSHTVSLRALNTGDHDVWLGALLDAMSLPHSTLGLNRLPQRNMNHFRYSTQVVEDTLWRGRRVKEGESDKGGLERMTRRLSKLAVSDTSIPGRFTVTNTPESERAHLRRSASVEADLTKLNQDNIYESVTDLRPFEVVRKRKRGLEGVKRSDSDRGLAGRLAAGKRSLESCLLNSSTLNKDIKSDTEISRRHGIRASEQAERFHEELSRFRVKMLSDSRELSRPPKRSNSLLRRFSKEEASGPTPKKRSMSFLKKMWKRRDRKWDREDPSISTNPDPIATEILGPRSPSDDFDIYTGVELTYSSPRPEPPPDYDEVTFSEAETEPPELPPRRQEEPREAEKRKKAREEMKRDKVRDEEKENEEKKPVLPVKLGLVSRDRLRLEEEGELSQMMRALASINAAIYQSSFNQPNLPACDEEPDYDVPRPHGSLLAMLRKESLPSDSMQATRFLEDSLDLARDDFDDLAMAPDSLECDPWSVSGQSDCDSEATSLCHDSLNTSHDLLPASYLRLYS